ncbi:MAG: hypothetical protein NT141_02725 [candidate division WWE3 bacterium]|nr:hypothetical protein [candidate division WWE3 bacterium]
MKIWFGTTTLNYKVYKDYYLKIRQYLLDQGHVLTDDWIGECGKWIEDNPQSRRDIKDVYRHVLHAIDTADVSVIEFTVPNFSTSHQITYTLQQHKPVLVLRLKRENTFPDSYIEALDSPYLTLKTYTLVNYKDIIAEFLNYSSLEDGDGRYNIVLKKRQKYFLDWAASKYKKSRSEIIRDLLNEQMTHDSRFKLYLQKP